MPDAVRTYLEMRDRGALDARRLDDGSVRIERIENCPASFYRYLYTEVGREYKWIDRLGWSDDQIRAHLSHRDVGLWLLTVRGAPAGYFELKRDTAGGVEIAYFGLLPEYIGRGLGGHLLTAAVEQAWSIGAARVWLHTNTLDHPAALANYLKRGFRAFHAESFEPGG
jgi:GNAT superfamily N-acetyltransferase